jgi:cell division protein FtsI/penicillin-binding protein 2
MKRSVLLSTAISFCFVLVLLRLGDLMLLNHEELSEKANDQYRKVKERDNRRGIILDRRGRELAMNRDVDSLWCDPKKLVSPQKAALTLSNLTGANYSDILKKFSARRKQHFVWVKRKMETEVSQRVRAYKGPESRAMGFQTEAKRVYPRGALASHVIGFVDLDNKARAGVEDFYEKDLLLTGGKVLIENDASGKVLSQGGDTESRGNNLVLTVDEGLQFIAEKSLDEAMDKWRAEAGSVIMMDPYTGEILAMANRPTYDPNLPGSVKPEAMRNRAIMDLYEPGSTFKLIVAAAAIEENAIPPGARFDCSTGTIQVAGRTFHDVHKNGILSFEEVIQKSSNVGSIQIGLRLGYNRLYSYAKKFGFGELTGIDLPSEARGRLTRPEKAWGTSVAALSIGYEVSVTPIQVLRAYSAVANGGLLPLPHVVSRVFSPEGELIRKYEPQAVRVLKPETAARLKKILSMVTEEGGTATLAEMEGNKVSGKTGTARLYDPRTRRYSGEYMSSFVGFVPTEEPKIAMIVVIKGAKGAVYGGVVAAPVFRDIAERAFAYMNVPRDDMSNNMIVLERDYEARKNPGWNKN